MNNYITIKNESSSNIKDLVSFKNVSLFQSLGYLWKKFAKSNYKQHYKNFKVLYNKEPITEELTFKLLEDILESSGCSIQYSENYIEKNFKDVVKEFSIYINIPIIAYNYSDDFMFDVNEAKAYIIKDIRGDFYCMVEKNTCC